MSGINYGMHALNLKPASPQATIVVLGLGRSGTTMTARVLQEIGLFLGDRLSPGKHEDLQFSKAILGSNKEAFARISRERDARYDKWGFKNPKIRKQLGMLSLLRNPRLVVMFRDPLAITLRNHLSSSAEFESSFLDVANNISKLVSSLQKLRLPMLLLSYEKALQHREEIVSALTDFCGLSPTPAMQRDAVTLIRNGDPRYLNRGVELPESIAAE